MPRGKTISDEEKIVKLETEKANYQGKIESLQAKVSAIDSQITEIHESRKRKEAENLLEIMASKGITVNEVKEILTKDTK